MAWDVVGLRVCCALLTSCASGPVGFEGLGFRGLNANPVLDPDGQQCKHGTFQSCLCCRYTWMQLQTRVHLCVCVCVCVLMTAEPRHPVQELLRFQTGIVLWGT